MRRKPALQSFGVEYRPMNRVVIAHRRKRFCEPALALRLKIRPCRKHAMVVLRRRPYLAQPTFGHQSLALHRFPKRTTDCSSVGPTTENSAHHFHFAGPRITVFA